jgi:hypothetical protein
VRLATFSEALDTNINNLAITPASMASATVERTAYGVKGDLLVAQSAGDPIALPIGTDGQVLTACAADVGGMRWTNIADDIPCSTISARGSLIVGAGPQTPGELTPGSQNQYLRVNFSCPNALEWVTVTNNFSIPCACLTNAGGLVTAIGAGQPAPLPRGSNCQILTVDTAATSTGGLAWKDNPAILKSQLQGCPPASLISVFNNTIVTQPGPNLDPANNGLALTYCTSSPTGLWWAEASPPQSCFTTKGQLYVGTGNKTLCALPVGGNGQLITADSTSPSGVVWAAPAHPIITYCCGTIDGGSTYGNACTYTCCGWLQGPGFGLPLGLWKVDIFGKYCTNAVANPDGRFYVSWWCDYNGGPNTRVACGPGLGCSPQQGGFLQFSYSAIASNRYCSCGIYFNTFKNDTANLEDITIFYTAIYLGQG